MSTDEFNLKTFAGTLLPETPAGKLGLLAELCRDTDDEGNPLDPILTPAEVIAILGETVKP